MSVFVLNTLLIIFLTVWDVSALENESYFKLLMFQSRQSLPQFLGLEDKNMY